MGFRISVFHGFTFKVYGLRFWVLEIKGLSSLGFQGLRVSKFVFQGFRVLLVSRF